MLAGQVLRHQSTRYFLRPRSNYLQKKSSRDRERREVCTTQIRLKQPEQQWQAQAESRLSEMQTQAEQELRRRELEFERQLEAQSREADTRFK